MGSCRDAGSDGILGDLKGLAAGAADPGRGPENINKLIFKFFPIKSAFSGFWGFKIDWKSCKTEFFEYSFGSPRDRPKILDPSRFRADFRFGLII